MTWSIQQVTVADAAAAAENNIPAFWDDPNWRNSWTDDIALSYLVEQSAKRQARNFLRDRDRTRHQKAVDPTTGKFVGYARWVLPEGEQSEEQWKEAQVPAVSADEEAQFQALAATAWWKVRKEAEHSDDRTAAVKKRILDERKYLMLEYLAVHPSQQKKGIATVLVKSGIKEAKKLGLPIYVLAFPAGHRLYEHLGFLEVDRVVEDLADYGGQGEYTTYHMVFEV